MAERNRNQLGEVSRMMPLLQQVDVQRDAGLAHIVGTTRRHPSLGFVAFENGLQMAITEGPMRAR